MYFSPEVVIFVSYICKWSHQIWIKLMKKMDLLIQVYCMEVQYKNNCFLFCQIELS